MNRFLDLQKYENILINVDEVEYLEKELLSKLKTKLTFIDFSKLHVKEIRLKGNLISYSYYWLRIDDSIIIGWDNSPHHPEIKTFPHHKHTGGKVESSKQRNLEYVLDFIKDYFE